MVKNSTLNCFHLIDLMEIDFFSQADHFSDSVSMYVFQIIR